MCWVQRAHDFQPTVWVVGASARRQQRERIAGYSRSVVVGSRRDPGDGSLRDRSRPITDILGSGNQDFNLAFAAGTDFFFESSASHVYRNQRHSSLRELPLNLGGYHSGRQPRSPVNRHHVCRPPLIEVQCELVQDFAGRRVVSLTSIAEAPGYGTEKDQKAKRVRPQPVGEDERAVQLG